MLLFLNKHFTSVLISLISTISCLTVILINCWILAFENVNALVLGMTILLCQKLFKILEKIIEFLYFVEILMLYFLTERLHYVVILRNLFDRLLRRYIKALS